MNTFKRILPTAFFFVVSLFLTQSVSAYYMTSNIQDVTLSQGKVFNVVLQLFNDDGSPVSDDLVRTYQHIVTEGALTSTGSADPNNCGVNGCLNRVVTYRADKTGTTKLIVSAILKANGERIVGPTMTIHIVPWYDTSSTDVIDESIHSPLPTTAPPSSTEPSDTSSGDLTLPTQQESIPSDETLTAHTDKGGTSTDDIEALKAKTEELEEKVNQQEQKIGVMQSIVNRIVSFFDSFLKR
ncbi:hypothetical protein KC726_00305 [Candidatus Woesebacteria bacterium]|nr:hypothetical protein [Candidatus Woesebacteria bacterium]